MKHTYFIVLLLTACTKFGFASFADLWMNMRREYKQLYTTFCEDPAFKKEIFYHPFWQKTTDEIRRFILGPPRNNFLHQPAISSTMVRSIAGGALDVGQYHELCYLNHCVKSETRRLIKKFNEPAIGNMIITCPEYRCSTNSLGQLYYAARIVEKVQEPEAIQTIVEVGAGFGNLACIFKSMLPDATIVLFDLPELIAIQYVYLSSALPDTDIIIHQTVPESLQKKSIHLVPVFLLPEINLKADVFVSNFALSESTVPVQEMVINKNFFDASVGYITGQLHGWKEGFVHQKLIHESMQAVYKTVDCLPFHIFYPGECESYELIATR